MLDLKIPCIRIFSGLLIEGVGLLLAARVLRVFLLLSEAITHLHDVAISGLP